MSHREIEIEGQQPSTGRPFYGSRVADVLQLGKIARARTRPETGDAPAAIRQIVRPGGVDMTDYGNTVPFAGKGFLVINRNTRRKRFVISNWDKNPDSLYFSFGPTSFSWETVAPGGAWDESGSEIFVGDLFIMVTNPAMVGMPYGALEGVPIEAEKDELRVE